MKNLTFKAAMLKGSQPTVNRQSTDGQSQRHCKQTPLSKRWKVLMTLVFLFTMGIGQMWGADPQDTYYKFTKTYSSNDTIRPKSGDGGVITLGSNSAAKVTASTAFYLGNEYSYAININNSDAKSFSFNINGSNANPAHVFVLLTSDNRTLKLKYNGNDIDQCGVRGTAGSSTEYTKSAALVELTTTNTGSHVIYASGSAFVYEVRVVYEKNSTWQAVKNLTSATLDKDQTFVNDLAELLFFRIQDMRFNTDGVLTASGATFNSGTLRYSVNFKAQKNGTVNVSCANPSNSGRTITVNELTRPSTAGKSILSETIAKNTTTYSTKSFDVEAGKEYVIGFNGAGATIKSVNFTAAPSSFTLSATATPDGYGTLSANSIDNIASGTSITTDNNVLTVGESSITASPTAQTAQYTYAFDSWKKSDDSALPSTVTDDLVVKAIFTREARSYSVTLNTNEGTINAGNVTSYTFGTKTTLPTNVTKENKDFKGWYASSDFSTERVYTIAADATGNKEYWAKWEAEAPKHDISYTNLKEQSVEGYPTKYSEGIGIASFDALSDVAGFHFTGWSPDAIPADATDDPFVVTAQWVPTYSVTYNLNGAASGTQPTETAKYAGEVFTLAAQGDIVAPANKRFAGWKDQDDNKYAAEAEFTMPGKPVTLTAQWVDVVTYVASFACANAAPANWEFSKAASDTYGAEAATADYVCKFVDGGTSTPSQTTGDGTSDNDVAFAKNPDAIATYDLGFTTTVTALNVTLCGGSSGGFDETIEYLGEDKSTVKKSYVTSLNAGNWKDNAISKTEDVADVRFIRVHGAGKWVVMKAFSVSYIDSRTKYDVTFAKNGGSGDDMPTLKYAEGEEVTLPACTFTAPGSKEFDAWTSTDVTITNNKFTMPNKNVTITATWKTATPKYHVTYDGNSKTSGTVPTDATAYEEGDEVTVLGKGDLARIIDGNAANFYGWNTKADMTGTHYDAGANFNIQNANVTLYAEWGYSIEYKLNNGSWKSGYTAPDHYIYGKGVTLPTAENVERVGFEFDGWYSEWHVNNQGGYINDNKRTAVGPSDYGNASYLASWTALPLGKAQSVDLEGLVEDEGTGANWQAYMTSHGYEYSTESVSLDEKKDPSENKAYDNWPYQGLKMKKTGSYVQGTVDAGKLVIIKLGHMAAAATVTIGGVAQANATGLDAAEPAGKYNYYYVANESVLRLQTNSNDACVLKAITITAPYTVSFDVNGGDAAIASMTGTPSIILPTPTKGTETFLGWFVGENKIGEAGESYMPTADVELVAHWEAVSSDARLSAIEITPNTGVLAPAFNMELTEYTYTMPYGTGAVPQITGATPNHEGASYGYLVQAENWGDVAEVRGIALSNDTKKYQITMVQGPKDGVEIISIAVKNGNGNAQTIAAEDISGFIGGTATQKLQNGSKKLGGDGNYIGFTLANSEELQAGDVIRLNVSATNGASHLTLYQDGSDANLVKDIEWTATEGINLIPIPSEAVGLSTLYIYRKSSVCNPTLSEFAILRPMDPVMTAITIDGRAGEIDPQDDKHFNVTIPFEANLAALTVEPTVFWNGAHATTPGAVTSHEGAWVLQAEGDNTYRVMDKDGDYTDYTITLIRDIQKFTVSYNTHGGTAIEPELVVADEHLTAAPAAPTQEDYIFQGWSLTEDGAVIDITNVTIDEDKTFHAIWLYENPIKLIQADTINTKDFITGVSINTVQIGDVTHKCFEFAGGLSDFINIKDKNRVVVYNATTNKTKIKVTMYNNKSTALTYYIKGVVEGSSDVVDIATIEVASGETKTSGYYEFNSAEAKNRTIYVYAETSTGNMHFLQVKVIDNGDVPVKKVAEVGYSLNFNKGRLFGRGSTSVDFEGIHFDLGSDYQPTASTSLKFANKSISFDVTDFVTMSVTTSNNKTYYVSRGAAGTDNETAVAGTTDFTLTPGKWFITAGSSNVEITNIAFAAKTPDYTRNVSVNIGTLCMEHNVLASGAVGATFYQIIGRNKDYSYKIDFEEIGPDEELKAGEPYIFQSTTGKIELYYGKTVAPQPVPVKGMIGNFEAGQLAITDENKLDILYIAQNKLWTCENLVGGVLMLNDHRAYIKMSDVPEQEDEAPAPGRRRVTLGMNAEQVVTAIGNTELNEQAVKVMIDGQLFIIRGEKVFDATGRLVK